MPPPIQNDMSETIRPMPESRPAAPRPQNLVGLSGWNYDDWKHGFYAGVRRKDWLAHYASVFGAVEVNATFYREQRPETFAAWRAGAPPGFRFAVKGHKYATHMKRLLDPERTVPRHLPALEGLGDRLSALLWQLPAHCRAAPERLDRFCAVLETHFPGLPQVLEFRHTSWFTDETLAVLRAHGAAPCISDAGSWPLWDATGADLAYLRLHGKPETYYSAYDTGFLRDLADRIRGWNANGLAAHVYFDNTARGNAPSDALKLLDFLA